MWIPTIVSPDHLLLYIGIVDALITLFLIVATGIEASFIGKTKHQCAQVPPNGTADQSLIFFERARVTSEKNPNYGEDLCKEFLVTFSVGTALM